MSGVQLALGGLPLDPVELAQLSTPERGLLYDQLDLDPLQRQAAEEGAREVVRGTYPPGMGQ